MKKYILILPLLISLAACSTSKKLAEVIVEELTPAVQLHNAVDSMSYSLGISVGTDFARNLETIPGGKSNKDLLVEGFSQALKKQETWLSLDEAQEYFQNYMMTAQERENEAKKASGENFLAENKKREGIKVTDSGLQYEVLTAVEGNKPRDTDRVKVHYTGTTIDGRVFDSSVERGEPVEFALNGVIAGWTEGVQLMSVGSKYKFYIPYNLAYGEQGVPQAGIEPFAPLIFEVELLEIK